MNSRFSYDSQWAFERALQSLEAFNDLIGKRHEAYYERKETLGKWIILGRFYFDSCGNDMRLIDHIPAEVFPDIPPVLSLSDFSRYAGEMFSFSATMGNNIPSHENYCPECHQRWNVQDCHNAVVTRTTEIVNLSEFSNRGITLRTVKSWFRNHQGAFWFVQPDKPIRNDRYIDHTIVDSDLGREYGWQVNELGWIRAGDLYEIQSGDEAMFNVWTYRHKACQRMHLETVEREYFSNIFAEAGYKKIKLTPIENQYYRSDHSAPWYQVAAYGRIFTIGWRKRVIEIRLENYPELNLERVFRLEEVTKGAHLIHAWGKDKCVEYLRAIRNSK